MNKKDENKKSEKENLTEKIGNYIVNTQIIIAKGSFGKIYKGYHYKTGEPVAIKTENNEHNSLRHETRILQHLYEAGIKKIPPIYWYGKSTFENIQNQVLILPFYSSNLETYIKNKQTSQTHLSQLIIKCLDIVQQIHSKFVVHRDIKPANFMIKNGDIFLIDFGLATFYLDENSQHICDKESDIVGTIKYSSINIHEGHRFSRRDDIISLIYLYDYMANGGNIRWSPSQVVLTELIQNMKDSEFVAQVKYAWLQSKKQYLLALSKNIYSDFLNLYKLYEMVYGIGYKDEPPYSEIKKLFEQTI
uniref:non-specific serine/threonine protein kinase n=1 Tax=viral metagenome TaxID=1070528 RepID=A0A6C0I0B3_9ZZZZ